jgi:glycosyltransferase involved in cell wall biosynthesis
MTNKNTRTVWYFSLEPLKARYTYQLSKEWMPATFAPYEKAGKLKFIDVPGEFDPDQQIKVGAVLDAVGRGKFAMSQCSNFLDMLNSDQVKDGDILFLQDYWHPGIESILYALDLYGINVKIYAMLHAQSVDEYDFTWPMRRWMRGFELGLDKRMSGIFVGSTIHRDQLRAAGFESPIHVVSLPLHKKLTQNKLPNYIEALAHGIVRKKDVVIYSSRLDKEKNPFFMMAVAEKFLQENPIWEWHVTTSGKEFKSMLPGAIEAMYELANQEPRFKLLNNLTKEEYYTELAHAKVQFNSSLQDYVSWTVLESTTFGCDLVFPDFRSFPEFIPANRMYKPFNVNSAVAVLKSTCTGPADGIFYNFPDISDLGRRMEAYIICNDMTQEINVWHESEYCKHLINKQGIHED